MTATPASTGQAAVATLVERFARNLEAYKRPDYKETQVRVEFVDPFFEALGWDVRNVQGYAEPYKDVVHEDALQVGAGRGAPDYCFRIGGTRKFFLEAKKPSVSLRTDVGPAYQLRRYAWSARLPLSVLTDFEELAVYDCRQRPKPGDGVAVGRVLCLTFDQYVDRWDEVYGIFGRESVLRGSFDRYVQDTKAKRGTGQVDVEFLKEIEGWRETLARNLALRNPALSVHELNFAVQHTIDRILFLRMAEDRGIEIYGRLLALCAGPHIYPRLVSDLYRQADEKYDSGLFDFQADRLTPALAIDDQALKPILSGLYYPASPYEFSVLPAEVLGQVYEQFLGKVIRLTAGHRAVVEEKPEVKKAGGVYYTPAYIVAYIVRQTVGRLVEGKSPRELRGTRGRAPLRVLDPACGSGSFLLGAYQFLLDHYRRWYEEHEPLEHARGKEPAVYQGPRGDWRLTSAEKKRILLDHIYGVDIDRQAVEVTKLSLLLQVLEGETDETLGRQLSFWHERALPDLGRNIQCGNSLIGPDFFEGQLVPDEEELRRVNPFDWGREFPEAMAAGGFDAVIGNPPYLKEANNKAAFDLLRQCSTGRYCVGKMDLWYAFACVALDLLRQGGVHAFIATNTWAMSEGATILRRKLLSEAQILQYVDFADYLVFRSASIQTMVYVVCKEPPSSTYLVAQLKIPSARQAEATVIDALAQPGDGTKGWMYSRLDPRRGERPFTLVSTETGDLLDRLSASVQGRLASEDIGNGIDVLQDCVTPGHLAKLKGIAVRTGDGIFVLSEAEMAQVGVTDEDRRKIKPYYTTSQIGRYVADRHNSFWIIYADKEVRENIDRFPGIKNHLDRFVRVMTSAFKPYGLHRPREEKFFVGHKILSLRKTRRAVFSLVDFPCYVSRAFLIIKPEQMNESLGYLLGLLNSRLAQFWLYHRGKKQGDQLQVDKEPLTELPIRTIDFTDPADVARHDRMVGLVERMLDLHKKLAAAAIPADRSLYERQIEATDRQIDALVYELYGLTAEEVAIVEGGG